MSDSDAAPIGYSSAPADQINTVYTLKKLQWYIQQSNPIATSIYLALVANQQHHIVMNVVLVR